MFLLQLNILKRKVKIILLHSPAHTFPSMHQTEPVVSHGAGKRTTSTKIQKMRAHRQQHSKQMNSPRLCCSAGARACLAPAAGCSQPYAMLILLQVVSCSRRLGRKRERERRCGWGGWTNRSCGGEGRRKKTLERGESDRKRLGRMESAVIRQVLLRFNSNASLGYIDAGYLDSSLSSHPFPPPPLLLSASPSL